MDVPRRKSLDGPVNRYVNSIYGIADAKPRTIDLYLIKDWILQCGTSVIFGPSNVGKSLLALDMALHVAAGMPWHGIKVTQDESRPFSVLFVSAEGGRGLDNRIAAVGAVKPELVSAADQNESFHIFHEPIDFHSTEDARELLQALKELNLSPALIIVDTLARTMGVGDENSAKDMGCYVRNIEYLASKIMRMS